MTALQDRELDVDEIDEPGRPYAGLRRTLIAIMAIAVLVVAVTGGWLLRGGGTPAAIATPKMGSVDAGFAQDMSTHHVQAVTMAGYERDTTTNPALKSLATDIETSQEFQVGEMQGWLDTWGLSRNNPHEMAWMGSSMGHMSLGADGLMPGMATPAQMTKFEATSGKAGDIMFLQLMIHHHQGGVQMAKYAAEHATEPYVVRLAGAMYTLQSQEIVQMEQMLRQLGGSPLPPPTF